MSSANRFEAFAAQHAFLETRPQATSVGRWLTQVWHGPYYPQFAGDEGAGELIQSYAKCVPLAFLHNSGASVSSVLP